MGLPTTRPESEVYAANLILRAMARSGMELFPLGIRSKMPRDKGFLLHSYEDMRWAPWLKRFGNVGVRARRNDLIIDVDPKNGGLESFSALQWDCDTEFDGYPRTLTGRGNGGFHLYMTKPEGARLRWHHKGYPGIDFQGLGRYVVAPGSVHPDTGLPYRLEGGLWLLSPPAPSALIDRLTKPAPPVRTGNGGDVMTVDEVAECLAVLDPKDYGQGGPHHDEWLDMAMSCHEASNGEAVDAWLEWCAKDPNYGEEASVINAARWESFDSTNRGPEAITYKTLLRAVSRAGHRALVSRLGGGVPASEEEWEDETTWLDRLNEGAE